MFARVHLDAIQLGIAEELEKYAASGSSYFDSNAPSMFPTLTGQARWKYARTKDGLKLHDGAQSYHFKGLPEEYPHEDTRVHWQEPTPHFEEGATSTGTAQIHRSSPDNIYVTLADGGHNPTFMLQHEQDKQWRYSPSKKFADKLKAHQNGTSMPQPTQAPKISPHNDTEDNKAGGNAQILSIPDFQEGVKHALDSLGYRPGDSVGGASPETAAVLDTSKTIGETALGLHRPVLGFLQKAAPASIGAKILPGAGLVLNAYDAKQRYNSGDNIGAGLSAAQAGLSCIPPPVGPLAAGAVGLGQMGYDYHRAKSLQPSQSVAFRGDSGPAVQLPQQNSPTQVAQVPQPVALPKQGSAYNPWTHHGTGLDANELSDKLVSLYDMLSNGFHSAVNMGANHPIATALGTAAAVRGYQMLRDAQDPNRIEERSQDPHKRNLHALYPIAAGIGHTALSSARAVPNQGGYTGE